MRYNIIIPLIIQLFCFIYILSAYPGANKEYDKKLSMIHNFIFQKQVSKQNLKKAIAHCKQALKKFPNSAEIYLYLARAYYKMGDNQKSLGIIKKAKTIIRSTMKKGNNKNTGNYLLNRELFLEISKLEKLISGRFNQEKYRENLNNEFVKKNQTGPNGRE